MTHFQRTIKRAVIVLIYLIILCAIGTAAFFLFRTKPTCTDGKRNQSEERIDCGGPCQKCEEIPKIENAQILEKSIVSSRLNTYDALVKIENPNSLFGIENLEYSFNFLDESGKIIAQKEGTSFLLPAETKYIFVFNADLVEKPVSLDFRIKSYRWQKFSEYEEPNIASYQKEFIFVSGGPEFAQLKLKIQNKSGYDFRKITTKTVLRDHQGNPVAVNETNNNDVRINEERDVVFHWSEPFAQDIDVQNIEVEEEVNVFSDENFMKKYGSPGQYDSYESN
ncbi:MAG: hypothetical protein UX02_C0003G0104 [Candidatus Moranbacteria bacterium GW2011_GWC1_45_18]|nr:MAG: hypothetical protein UT79_C0004G0105 [Candidatus Moranbacteria bacterium GW2011_GWC2_40_12]KKT32163.1 MAG: hypothetical protein UW19_C0030G0004 [Candidatus Moranbacteria bacterium GW2011_GWF2_44_10]KKT71360.1 MAG: hypothetical protein UW66_C0035G0002 [Candidatus Moranbacteria bacterium GW2011_GWF1_44_4]KKT99561.1 MAG: hypothetical protein UX02_C0003G0104 [Candidatus Moranbacteria bacterium GW2011_GWC1_45_18]OGI37012.1 MAG: hypothetical protein A2407_02780 [Candidatus Moranbacteria bacte